MGFSRLPPEALHDMNQSAYDELLKAKEAREMVDRREVLQRQREHDEPRLKAIRAAEEKKKAEEKIALEEEKKRMAAFLAAKAKALADRKLQCESQRELLQQDQVSSQVMLYRRSNSDP